MLIQIKTSVSENFLPFLRLQGGVALLQGSLRPAGFAFYPSFHGTAHLRAPQCSPKPRQGGVGPSPSCDGAAAPAGIAGGRGGHNSACSVKQGFWGEVISAPKKQKAEGWSVSWKLAT